MVANLSLSAADTPDGTVASEVQHIVNQLRAWCREKPWASEVGVALRPAVLVSVAS